MFKFPWRRRRLKLPEDVRIVFDPPGSIVTNYGTYYRAGYCAHCHQEPAPVVEDE